MQIKIILLTIFLSTIYLKSEPLMEIQARLSYPQMIRHENINSNIYGIIDVGIQQNFILNNKGNVGFSLSYWHLKKIMEPTKMDLFFINPKIICGYTISITNIIKLNHNFGIGPTIGRINSYNYSRTKSVLTFSNSTSLVLNIDKLKLYLPHIELNHSLSFGQNSRFFNYSGFNFIKMGIGIGNFYKNKS